MTFMCDVKIDVNICEPHYVNLIFFVNLLHGPDVWLFHLSPSQGYFFYFVSDSLD